MKNKVLYLHIRIAVLVTVYNLGGYNLFLVSWGIIHPFSFYYRFLSSASEIDKLYCLTFFPYISYVVAMYSYSEQVCETCDDHVMVMQNAAENF
jgi:hypothetical protein